MYPQEIRTEIGKGGEGSQTQIIFVRESKGTLLDSQYALPAQGPWAQTHLLILTRDGYEHITFPRFWTDFASCKSPGRTNTFKE